MKERDFLYWLQGFVEFTGGVVPTQYQLNCIVEHLESVEGNSLTERIKGFFEINGIDVTEEQWKKITEMLSNAFELMKKTPSEEILKEIKKAEEEKRWVPRTMDKEYFDPFRNSPLIGRTNKVPNTPETIAVNT